MAPSYIGLDGIVKPEAKSMRKTAALIGVLASLFACSKPPQEKALDRNLAIALSEPEKATKLTYDSIVYDGDALPAELWTLTNLRELNLPCTEGMKALPPEIGKLKLLETLTIDCGNGGGVNTSLPEEIGNLTNLTTLKLYGAMDPREPGEPPPPRNRFKDLPDSVRTLTKLRNLNLGRNGLPYVPPQIASLENLETLDLSFNAIDELPEFIGNLRKLRELALDGNGRLNLPASLSQIKGLRVIAGNDDLDLKAQNSLRQRFPNITFDFENEYDDCASNEPSGGYEAWRKECATPANRPRTH